MLKRCIQDGKLTRDEVLEHKKVFSELPIVNGLIVRGEQIVIPRNLRNQVVGLMRDGHMGFVLK